MDQIRSNNNNNEERLLESFLLIKSYPSDHKFFKFSADGD